MDYFHLLCNEYDTEVMILSSVIMISVYLFFY